MRARPFNFRFSERDPGAKSQGAARKINISRQYWTEVTFQSWVGHVTIQNQKPRNPRRAASISNDYPKTTIFSEPSRFLLWSPSCIFLSPEPFDVCWKLFHICTRATPSTIGPQNIYFLGPRFIRPSGRSERGPLNLVKRRQWTGRDTRFWLQS